MEWLALTMMTLGIAAGMALLLGAVGLYGVLSYVVAQRTREIGVGMALGAEAARVRRMVVAQGARVVGLRALFGVVGAALATRAPGSMLFGVEVLDAGTFAATAAFMVAPSPGTPRLPRPIPAVNHGDNPLPGGAVRPTPPDEQFLAFQEALAGRYSLERELGRGGMGVVYLARDIRLERRVAIKLLPLDHAARPAFRERFLREARTAAKLSHPNIVPIFSVDEVDGFVFFVMAFVEGETLGERVRRAGPLSPRIAARVLREVSWALAYAHAQGVVHRDVKPDNVLLETDSGRALVTDFGIAHAGEGAGLTAVGELLGTPEYMSPEQAGGEEFDGRSDLYAVGVMGHFALSGTVPLQGPTVQATLAKQLTQPAAPLATVAPEVPEPLCRALDRCLAKNPADRFQGGEELAEALGGVVDARPQVPAAIRLFVDQNAESTTGIVAALMFGLMMVTVYFLASTTGNLEEGMGAFFVLVTSLAFSLPLVMLGLQARRLVKGGHGRDELLRALEGDLSEKRRELAARTGAEPGLLDVWAPRTLAAGLGILLFVLPVLTFVLPFSADWVLGVLGLLGTGMLGVGGVVTGILHGLRKSVPGARWLTFWKSPLGGVVFGLAGLGTDRSTGALGGSYRPTEVAIGMAAERLFADLPADARGSLGDVPGVVETLEGHATRMRERIADLDRVLAQVGEDGPSAAEGDRDAVAAEVRRMRAAAEDRLRQVVAALEAIRLELLRLHAGSGSVESLTADLGAARELAGDMERIVQAQDEVAGLLAEPLDTPDPPSPVPA